VTATAATAGDDRIERWWPTPILIHRWPDVADINRALEAAILERMRASPGQRRSNIGGWHSNDDLLAWPTPAVARLKEWAAAGVSELHRAVGGERPRPRSLRITAWANVNRPGDANDAHEHGNHAWSGVYYVATGSAGRAAETGHLEIYDPRAGAGRLNIGLSAMGASRLVRPEAELMVVFPSWLLHAVRPHAEGGLRISIAFNISEVP
jgi:uncharacterized protein (TIGR02466 family)